MPEYGFTVTEHDRERPWIVLGSEHYTVALEDGAVAFDGPPTEFLAWAAGGAPELLPSAARLFAEAGLRPLPADV